MKYLLLLISFSCFAQENYIFTAGIDPKLAINGAYDYDKSSVIDFTFAGITGIGNNEYGLYIEYAKLEPYYFSTGLLYNRKIDLIWGVDTMLGGEVLLLQRGGEGDFLSYGINATSRIYILDSLAVGLRFNYKRRPFLEKFVGSGYLEVSYIIERW